MAENRPKTGETDVTEAELLELAKAPMQTKTEEAYVMERPASDLIALDRYIQEKANLAANNGAAPWGMRVARTIPGGTC